MEDAPDARTTDLSPSLDQDIAAFEHSFRGGELNDRSRRRAESRFVQPARTRVSASQSSPTRSATRTAPQHHTRTQAHTNRRNSLPLRGSVRQRTAPSPYHLYMHSTALRQA